MQFKLNLPSYYIHNASTAVFQFKLSFRLNSFASTVANQAFPLTDEQQKKPDSFIALGYAAYRGKALYIVSIEMQMEGIDIVDFCSGSIIGHTSILTAAHCITRADFVAIHYGSNLKATGWFNLWERYWTNTYI